MEARPSFDKIALETATIWSKRSEDLYQKVGACILDKDGRVLSIGYNGLSPKLTKPASFWKDRDNRRNYIIHAEINALSLVKRQDEPYLIAVNLLPCSHCALNIACYGIKKVVYSKDYERDQKAKDIFKFYDIQLIKIN